MIYSSTCEYAVQALTELASHPGDLVQVKRICRARDIPYYFLAKIMQSLAKAQFVRSVQGRNGGFVLARPPETITLYDIKSLIDGTIDLDHCVLGNKACSAESPCSHHRIWASLQAQILSFLQNTTLADLAAVERDNTPPQQTEVYRHGA